MNTERIPGRQGAAIPALFVFLWSTGFIGARYGLPHAEPFTLLAIRMAAATVLLLVAVWVLKARWPATSGLAGHAAMAGLLVHGAYLGGVFYAVWLKLPLGQVALIVGLQPILTALLAGPLLGERLGRWQWLGMVLGFAGVVLVVADKAQTGLTSLAAISACGLALAGITLGTLYQKRFCTGMDLATGGVIQFAASGCLFALGAWLIETRKVAWNTEFLFALAWLTLVLSLGAITLLYVLIRRGAAAQVASLFFLTPPTTAVLAYLLFGEVLSFAALFGLGLAAIGVGLVAKGK